MDKHRPSISIDQQLSQEPSNSVAHWKSLYENEHLARLKQEEQNKVLRIRYQRVLEKRNWKPTCEKCRVETNDWVNKTVNSVKTEARTFSKQIQNRLRQIADRACQDIIESSSQEIGSIDQFDPTEIPFIENFAVLGIDDDAISKYNKHEKEEPDGGVILSMRKVTAVEEHAVHFAVPSGMSVKGIPKTKILEKVPKIMINHSRQNTFLLAFKQEPGRFDNLNAKAKELLDLLNPNRRLFCFCVGTYDFTCVKKQGDRENDVSFTNNSFQLPHSVNDSGVLANSEVLPSIPSMVQSEEQKEQIRVSQRVYCIFSYFPFFSFFSNILLNLLNLVKLERLEIFRDRIEDIRKIDSRFQLKRIKKLYLRYLKDFNRQPARLDLVYHLNLVNESLPLKMDRREIIYSESAEWDYQILSLFTLDTFMEVLTLFLLEDKLFFICDQSRILTFAVYFVSTYLCRPFKWVFQYVCIIPKEEQFLNTPFPSAYGVLKKKEWIKQKQILEHFKNTYVLISPAGIEVKYTQKKNDILDKRSKKLRDQLAPLFQKMEKRKKLRQQLLNYENEKPTEYNWYSELEDRAIVSTILETVKKYMADEVLRHIPNLETIAKIRDRVNSQIIHEKKDPHSYLIEQIVSHTISQRNSKDPFVDQLLKTQMLSQHISELVDQLDLA